MMNQILKKLFGRQNPEEEAMKYCYDHGFKAGKNFHYNSGYLIDSNWPWLISVGDDVTLATGVKLLAHDASTARISGVHTKIGIVKIGNNVFIGANSIVLCNTRIGDNVIIGAGSVVTHDIPSNSVYAGNPAKFICTYDDFATKHRTAQKDHKRFNKYKWSEWQSASKEEWKKMREDLQDTYGYL